MCLAALAIEQSPRFPWVLASNRDEFFQRPTEPMAWWQPEGSPEPVLSGRDLSAGGTWLSLTRTGRLALVTNVREPGRHDPAAASRGMLALQALSHAPQDTAWLEQVVQVPRNGYNLVLADLRSAQAVWTSNRGPAPRVLDGGLHAVSNALLDTPWPKVTQLKRRLAEALASCDTVPALQDRLLIALADPRAAPDAQLPHTGIPLERERQLSSAYIRIADAQAGPAGSGSASRGVYGTRCSTVVVLENGPTGRLLHVLERSYTDSGAVAGEVLQRFPLDWGSRAPADVAAPPR